MVIVYDYTAKYDVLFLKTKDDVYHGLRNYKVRAENVAGFLLVNIRLDRAGENTGGFAKRFCTENGIRLEYSPKYAPEINGIAERFMQELGIRARVLLYDGHLGNKLWAEAMQYAN